MATGFSSALESQVKLAQSARAIATLAEADAIKAKWLGMTGKKPASDRWVGEVAIDVCTPTSGIYATDTALAAFGDSVEVLKKVAEKPADVSYAAYVTQFRKNNKYLDTAVQQGDPAAVAESKRKALMATLEARERCHQLFMADSGATLYPPRDALVGGEERSLATILAFDVVLKAVLGGIEKMERDEAVRSTAVNLTRDLRTAHAELANTDLGTFSPRVDYAPVNAQNPAATMNRTRLGATITLHRWYLAQEIRAITSAMTRCDAGCLGDAANRKNLDDLVQAMLGYRALSAIDTDQALKSLSDGLDKAQKVADGNVNLADILDGFLAIADSLSGIDKAYNDYQDTRKK
jgi:hypothetical protein